MTILSNLPAAVSTDCPIGGCPRGCDDAIPVELHYGADLPTAIGDVYPSALVHRDEATGETLNVDRHVGIGRWRELTLNETERLIEALTVCLAAARFAE